MNQKKTYLPFTSVIAKLNRPPMDDMDEVKQELIRVFNISASDVEDHSDIYPCWDITGDEPKRVDSYEISIRREVALKLRDSKHPNLEEIMDMSIEEGCEFIRELSQKLQAPKR